MASSNCTRITSLLLLITLSFNYCGVFGRAVGSLGHLSQPPKTTSESHEAALRTRRWRRGPAGTHRERCADHKANWLENTREAQVDSGIRLHLHIRSFVPKALRRSVFPGNALVSFFRGVYLCCQEGAKCKRLRGIQGLMRAGKKKCITLTK